MHAVRLSCPRDGEWRGCIFSPRKEIESNQRRHQTEYRIHGCGKPVAPRVAKSPADWCPADNQNKENVIFFPVPCVAPHPAPRSVNGEWPFVLPATKRERVVRTPDCFASRDAINKVGRGWQVPPYRSARCAQEEMGESPAVLRNFKFSSLECLVQTTEVTSKVLNSFTATPNTHETAGITRLTNRCRKNALHCTQLPERN